MNDGDSNVLTYDVNASNYDKCQKIDSYWKYPRLEFERYLNVGVK